MVVLNQVFGELAGIGDHLLADAVLDEGLLEQDVPAVFLVGQDASDMDAIHSAFPETVEFPGPPRPALISRMPVPGQIAVVDEAHRLRLLRDNPGLAVRALLIAQ